jgi:hypothetical protein
LEAPLHLLLLDPLYNLDQIVEVKIHEDLTILLLIDIVKTIGVKFVYLAIAIEVIDRQHKAENFI